MAPSGEGSPQWWNLDGEAVHVIHGTTRQVSQMVLAGHVLVTEGYFPAPGSDVAVPQLQAWDLWRRCLQWTRAAQAPEGARFAPGFGPLLVLSSGQLLAGTGRALGEVGVYDLDRAQVLTRYDVGMPWTAAAEDPDGIVSLVAVDASAHQREVVRIDRTIGVVQRRPIPFAATHHAMAAGADRIVWAEGSTVVLSTLGSGRELARYTLLDETGVSSLTIREDGERIVVGARSGRVQIVRPTGEMVNGL